MSDIPENLVDRLKETILWSIFYGARVYHDAVMRIPPEPKRLEIAATLLFQAVELSLKARLAMKDPTKIYEDPKKPHYTVGFDELVKRLHPIRVAGLSDFLSELTFIKNVRNSIIHLVPDAPYVDIDQSLGVTLCFLKEFLRRELGLRLEDRPEAEFGEKIERILMTTQKHETQALKRIQDSVKELKRNHVKHAIETCETCGKDSLLIPDPRTDDDTAYCFVCTRKFYQGQCCKCNRLFASSFPLGGIQIECRECKQAIP